MRHVATPLLLAFSLGLGLAACNDNDALDRDPGGRRVLSLASASDDCENPVTICRESYPPQCDTYCADAPPPDCDQDGACDDCVVSNDDSGQEILACPGDDCSVSYDVATGVETIDCPPSTGGGDGEPGSSDGCSGDRNGNGVCDDDE